ncbi:surface glycan-binding family protein [Alistipes megaguti]|uniref:surface glycan-binding family protein n=1 Tax=Alistipes megaguti TaxID=2364787 RepID=UPI002357ED0F|nr:surface glycan-binding family protein [Alistipes megaguti]
MKSLFRNICLAVLGLLSTAAFTACGEDETSDGGLDLYYASIVDIGPSMLFNSDAPTWYGPTPSEFAITAITLNDAAVTSESFTINSTTGVVSITHTENLEPGVYKLTISCLSGGVRHTFKDIFTVHMSPATPEALELSSPTLEIPYAELETSEAKVTVTPVGESVSIQSYSLVQPEGEEYFSISLAGEVTLNANFKGEVMPGNYPLPITVKTYAGEMTYEGLLTGRITSEPLSVSYPTASGRIEAGMSFLGTTPTLKGSPDEVAWAIRQIRPGEGSPETDLIKIDPATGVISVDEGNNLQVGAVYTVDLTVTNSFGSTDFDGAYTLTVVDYIEPIDASTFAYDPVEAIQGGEFKAEKRSGFVGDEAVFAFGTLPAAVEGQLTIDQATGAVSATKGHSIPLGEYEIPVVASNLKGQAETTLRLTVGENPYYFTTISYGNNLGLTPAENYASQFRCPTSGDLTSLQLTPTTDAKPGTQLTWSIKIKHQCKETLIDSQTGVISPKGFKANNGGLILVTATAGKGQVGETSVTVPVFFSFIQAVSGVTIHYTPFVFQVNPRTGGTSAAPTVEGVDPSLFAIDYRRTFNYYNIAGPHTDGQPSTAGSFMNSVWSSYYTSIGSATVNTGSKDPVSYYSNTSRLSSALCYVDPTTKALVVNPNKWVDGNGVAANGAMIGQMTFVTDGNSGNVSNGSQVFPIWIWFDEKF